MAFASPDVVYNTLVPVSIPVMVGQKPAPIAIVAGARIAVTPPLLATATSRSTSVVLNGSASYDTAGGSLTYSWQYLRSFTQVLLRGCAPLLMRSFTDVLPCEKAGMFMHSQGCVHVCCRLLNAAVVCSSNEWGFISTS